MASPFLDVLERMLEGTDVDGDEHDDDDDDDEHHVSNDESEDYTIALLSETDLPDDDEQDANNGSDSSSSREESEELFTGSEDWGHDMIFDKMNTSALYLFLYFSYYLKWHTSTLYYSQNSSSKQSRVK